MHTHADSKLRLPSGSVKPDYEREGLFSLVASIRDFLDGKPWVWPGTCEAAPENKGDRLLVLLLIDGLGDMFIQRHGQGSALLSHRCQRLTSVFPSTTACAIMTLMTGLSPAEHGLTGWFIHDRRFGGVLAPLPLTQRGGGAIADDGALTEQLFPYDSLFMGRFRPSIQIAPVGTAFSPFSARHGQGAKTVAYDGLDNLIEAIATACASFDERGGYVYAYYPLFDTVSHDYGCESEQAIEEFWHVDGAFQQLLARLDGKDVDVVVSADHGFIDSSKVACIEMNSMPEMHAMLASPLFGERRAAFCRVKAGAEKEFERLVCEKLAGKGVCNRSALLLDAGFFGSGPFHPLLRERIGDYALLMEPGWTIYDTLPGEKPYQMIGVHGGLAPQEMWVPLIHARC